MDADKLVKIKEIQVGLLFFFLVLCLISTMAFSNTIAPRINDEILSSVDTTMLYVISDEIWSAMVPIPFFPVMVLLLKFFSITIFFGLNFFFMTALKGKKLLINFTYLILGGLVWGIHFVGFESTSQLAILIRKFYISYLIGITSFPLVLYYGTVILVVVIMIAVLLWELKQSGSRFKKPIKFPNQ